MLEIEVLSRPASTQDEGAGPLPGRPTPSDGEERRHERRITIRDDPSHGPSEHSGREPAGGTPVVGAHLGRRLPDDLRRSRPGVALVARATSATPSAVHKGLATDSRRRTTFPSPPPLGCAGRLSFLRAAGDRPCSRGGGSSGGRRVAASGVEWRIPRVAAALHTDAVRRGGTSPSRHPDALRNSRQPPHRRPRGRTRAGRRVGSGALGEPAVRRAVIWAITETLVFLLPCRRSGRPCAGRPPAAPPTGGNSAVRVRVSPFWRVPTARSSRIRPYVWHRTWGRAR
ncbi:hypothetical protein UA74_22590 [Actinoalloteichus fjordicus]|uniref:Uncharacterized protein n=1 Tax=Actinoalloteichus fjordicus TaxID=1612552 RepID=A0AAC9PU36_9PSEU|nr:hypothetical protein UA74_22590 [Actinoalloteichus fjordicus]